MRNELTFVTRTGPETAELFDGLARLRIAVFYEFPYLYEGDFDYERNYLSIYASSSKSLVHAVFDGGRMVGATTCLPLSDEGEEVKEPFLKTGMDVDRIFYFGESILLPEYRGRGLGHRFFDVREAHAQSFGTYDTTCFCAVKRPADHPLRPSDYRPNDVFWTKRGYIRHPELTTEFEWLDRGRDFPDKKEMEFWLRQFSGVE